MRVTSSAPVTQVHAPATLAWLCLWNQKYGTGELQWHNIHLKCWNWSTVSEILPQKREL